jgi:hypothetical protein
MRITAMLGLVLVTAFAPVFAAQPATPSFLGEWTVTIDTPAGKVLEKVTAVKSNDGYAVTGKLVAQDGSPEAGPGTDIVLSGDSFSYKRTVETPGGPLVINYSGVVSGETFTGTVDLGFAKAPYNGVRSKPGQ